MRVDGRLRPPLIPQWVVRAAGWIVPAPARPEWRAQWDSALWDCCLLSERGELIRRQGAILRAFCFRSIRDAFHTRIPPERLTEILRSPEFPLYAAVAMLVAIGLCSAGFRGTRALFDRVPVEEPDRLVSIRYSGAAGQPSGVPPRLVPLWSRESSLLSGVAAYTHRPFASNARVTVNFFDLLGTRPALGRVFRNDDGDSAILSATAWRTTFGKDSHVLGRRIVVEGHEYTVIGVLPDSFWAISRVIGVWTPLPLEPQPRPDLPFLIGAVGRLKPGVTPEKLRTELMDVTVTARQTLRRRPEVARFTNLPASQWQGYLFGIAFALGIGGVLVVLRQPIPGRQGWRYWRFLAAKALLLPAVPALLWVETNARIPPPTFPQPGIGTVLTAIAVTIIFVSACALGFWWSFADQRQRCPQCLRRLSMPITLGHWSSVLEPVTTEFLCGSGHGSLCLAETQIGERDRWTALDASWRELFR